MLARCLAAVAGAGPSPHATPGGTLYWSIENNLVRDVMTRRVVAVAEETPFRQIVDRLGARRISAVPVVDAGNRVIGIVSVADLLAEAVSGHPSVAFRGLPSGRAQYRHEANAETARELMTTPVITVRPDDSIVHAARIAAIEHVRRLPVVDRGGILQGIVARSDLLRVFLRGDEQIRDRVVRSVLPRFGLDNCSVGVSVQAGVATVTGQVERRMITAPLLDAVRATTGSRGRARPSRLPDRRHRRCGARTPAVLIRGHHEIQGEPSEVADGSQLLAR